MLVSSLRCTRRWTIAASDMLYWFPYFGKRIAPTCAYCYSCAHTCYLWQMYKSEYLNITPILCYVKYLHAKLFGLTESGSDFNGKLLWTEYLPISRSRNFADEKLEYKDNYLRWYIRHTMYNTMLKFSVINIVSYKAKMIEPHLGLII